jgi:hypothetical protein
MPGTDIDLTRREAVDSLPVLADGIDAMEQAEHHFDLAVEQMRVAGKRLADANRGIQDPDKIAEAERLRRRYDELVQGMREAGEQLAEVKQRIQTNLDTVLTVFGALGGER